MQKQLLALVRLTVQDPRRAASVVLSNNQAQASVMLSAGLVVVLGVLVSWITANILPVTVEGPLTALLQNPLLLAVIQFMMLMISAIAIFVIGRLFGGKGSFEQSLLISVWLQFVMLLVQVVSLPIAVVNLDLAARLNGGVYLYFIWLMVNFIAQLHSFPSRLKVLGGLVATSVVASFVILFVLAFLGLNIGTT